VQTRTSSLPNKTDGKGSEKAGGLVSQAIETIFVPHEFQCHVSPAKALR